jgi:hypothetical protein
MLKRWTLVGMILCLAASLACAADKAEKFEDKALGIALEVPEGFTKPDQKPPFKEELGELVAFYADKKVETTRGMMAVHHMPIPDGATYDQFKGAFEQDLAKNFGKGYSLVSQGDTKVEGLTGFMLECEVPGDGNLPKEGGNVQHHLRWYFFREGESKLTGVVYHALQANWEELKPKIEASVKSIKKAG